MITRATTSTGEVRHKVRVYAGGRKQWIGSFALKKDALAAEREAKNLLAAGRPLDSMRPDPVTVGELCDEWILSRRADLATGTMADYGDAVRIIKNYMGASTLVVTLDASDVDRFVHTLSRVKTGSKKTYSASTVKKTVVRLRSILRLAVKRRYIAASPAEGDIESVPEHKKKTVRPLSRADVDRVMLAAGPWYAPLIFVAATTGLRQSELTGLMWDAVELDARKIEVKRQRYKGILKDELKTDAARRTVELSPEAVLMLKGLKARAKTSYVFTGERGGPVNGDRFSNKWREWTATAKLPVGTVFHHLRHTYASILIHEGCSAKAVQYRMGHSKVQTTLDLYGHLWPEDAEKARQAVDRWASGALTGHSAPETEEPQEAKRGI